MPYKTFKTRSYLTSTAHNFTLGLTWRTKRSFQRPKKRNTCFSESGPFYNSDDVPCFLDRRRFSLENPVFEWIINFCSPQHREETRTGSNVGTRALTLAVRVATKDAPSPFLRADCFEIIAKEGLERWEPWEKRPRKIGTPLKFGQSFPLLKATQEGRPGTTKNSGLSQTVKELKKFL